MITHEVPAKAIFLQACLPVSNVYIDPEKSPEEVTGSFGQWMLLNQQQHKECSAQAVSALGSNWDCGEGVT